MNDLKSEIERRFSALRTDMQAQGVDVLVLYSGQWRPEIVHYVSNYRLFGPCACALLPLGGDPVLFISDAGDYDRAKETGWIRDVRVFENYSMEEAAAVARGFGRTAAIAGIETMTQDQYAAFAGLFGENNVKSGFTILNNAAIIKSPAEIEILRECAQIADAGFLAMIEETRIGIKEYEMAAHVNYAMSSAGADDNFEMIAIGRDLSCMHVPREYALRAGDFVLSEITPFKGSITYAVQQCRTIKAGKASDVESGCYNMLVEALESALAIIKPGVRAKDVALIQNQIIGKRGYEKYCNPPYMRSRGHNHGLGIFELTVDNEMELQPGMSMIVHPNQFVPETGYLACGTQILVTETGIERLSALPAKLYEVEVDNV